MYRPAPLSGTMNASRHDALRRWCVPCHPWQTRARALLCLVVAVVSIARADTPASRLLPHPAPAGAPLSGGPTADVPDFQDQILPLFYHRCFSCHSEKQDKPKGDLRLDSAEGLQESGVVIPGKPDESELFHRVSLPHDDADLMPRIKGGGTPLTDSEQALLRRWIAGGAPLGGWIKFNHREPPTEFTALPLTRDDVPRLTQTLDDLVAAYHGGKGTSLNPLVSDETFLRRVYLDVIGRIPSPTERQHFLEQPSLRKRAELIDSLLQSEGYVSHTFNWKADQLRLLSKAIPGQPGWLYDDWVKDSVRSRQPYDDFVRQLITASGYLWENGAAGFYVRDLGMPLDHLSNLSRVFLGTRIECAQCHDHPLEPVTQKDFYQLAAFTYGVSNLASSSGFSTDNVRVWKELQVMLDSMQASESLRDSVSRTTSYLKRLTRDTPAQLKFPEDYASRSARGQLVHARTLFGDEAPVVTGSPRAALAEWLVSPRNPRFTRNIVNRLWKRVIGVGLVEPVDSFTAVTHPALPSVLDFLTESMARLGYDERSLLAVILNSRLYQSETVRQDLEPGTVFSLQGPLLRRLSAEQIWDPLLVLIVPDLDARRSRVRHDQSLLGRERLEQLTQMSAAEMLSRAQTELEQRQSYRAYQLRAAEQLAAIKACEQRGDHAEAARLRTAHDDERRRIDEARKAAMMGNSYSDPETDPR